MRHTGRKKTAGGLSKEPFYQVFHGIRKRITDPTSKNYKSYGGRGLTFDWNGYVEFKKDMYESFLKHCEEHGRNNTTIERIDNNKGYSKENCRWATQQEQQKNKRSSRYITYKGETMIVADWARRLNISRQTLRYRLEKGWDIKSIIETPFNYANRYDKKTLSASTKFHK